ncbi:MAG: hypothetical protein CMM25_01850 [Rhodospirillaceae bacterium]|nr:hypothetical protein [Rhodospirillaceae bacterium]
MSESREWTAARDEYTYQLVQEISPPILEIFDGIYNKAREDAGDEEEDKTVVLFQLELQQIPHWNNISIERECKRIITGYPTLMDHVAAVFVSNIQILSCVRLDTDSKKDIHIKIPPRDTFIHKVLIQCAENIFADPILFWHNIEYGEKRENKKKKVALISESIEEAIRGMLPIQEILKEYLAETGGSGGSRAADKDDDAASVASKESEEPDSDSSGPEHTSGFDLDSDDEDDEDNTKHIPYSGDIGGDDGVPEGASSFGPPPTPPPEQYQPGGPSPPTPPGGMPVEGSGSVPGQNMFSGGPTQPPPAPGVAPGMASANMGGGENEPGHHESTAWEGDSSDDSDDDE